MKVVRNFKGIWIPKEIWENKNLTVMEKLFLVEIDSLDNEDGCFAGNKYFSEFFEISKGRCTQILKELERKKLVSIEIERKGKQIIKRVVRILNTPIEKIKQPYLENDEDNNTIDNNRNSSNKDELQKNVNLLEITAMHNKLSVEFVTSKIDEFLKHSKSIDSKYSNNQDLFSHFSNWIRKRNFNENENSDVDDSKVGWFIDMFNHVSRGNFKATDEVKKLFAKQLANGFTGIQMEKAAVNLYSSDPRNKFHKDSGYQYATPVHLLKDDNVNKYLNQRF